MYFEDKTIKLYLQEIGKTKLLTREEEVKLAKRILRGNAEAREHLIKANLRLVVKIAQDYSGLGLPLLDLISEGNIGLMKGVERFDHTRGSKFSTYASWWIKQSIRRALANQSKTIRLPAHLVDKLSKMRKIIHSLNETLGREPTNAEIAEQMKAKPGMVAHWRNVSQRPTSLDAPVGDDQGSNFSELIGDDSVSTPFESLNDRQIMEEMQEMMGYLDDREQKILKYRYGLNGVNVETLETVGERFKITRERVRQIQNAAIEKVQEMMKERNRTQIKSRKVAA